MKTVQLSVICGVVARVITEMAERANMGFSKYGKTLDRKDLTRKEWFQHGKEEVMDLANYLQRAIDEEDVVNTVLQERYTALRLASLDLFEHFKKRPNSMDSDDYIPWVQRYKEIRQDYLNASQYE